MTFHPPYNGKPEGNWKPVARIVLPIRVPSWNQIKGLHWRNIKKIDDKLHIITSMCIQEQYDSETGITSTASPSKMLLLEAELFGRMMTRLTSGATRRKKKSQATQKKKP